MAIVFVISLKLVNSGYYSQGKLTVALYSNIIIFINGSLQGRDAGNYFLFFPIMAGMFMLFSLRKERSYLLFSLIITLLCLVFMEYTDYSFLSQNAVISVAYQQANYIFSLILALSMVSLFSFSHVATYQSAEFKLRKLNIKLKRQNVQLQKANAELDSFVYKASHDLRAPLTSLLGLIEVMRLENDVKKNAEYTALQIKLVKKLDSYIQDILNISKNERLPIELQPIEFEDLVKDYLAQLQYAENYDQINKHLFVQQSAPFYSDLRRVGIIFNNLLTNAIRYSDFGKEFPNISIKIIADEKEVQIEVRDNGIGISREHLSKVFKMFYRATDTKSGSGLGLYIVSETVERLGGEIKLTSEAGKWTCFNITLPNNNM